MCCTYGAAMLCGKKTISLEYVCDATAEAAETAGCAYQVDSKPQTPKPEPLIPKPPNPEP